MENKTENNLPKNVPFFLHEAECTRLEKIIKRLWILAVILIALLVLTNAVWIWYESQYVDEYTVITAEQEADDSGKNLVIGGDFYGETESDNS